MTPPADDPSPPDDEPTVAGETPPDDSSDADDVPPREDGSPAANEPAADDVSPADRSTAGDESEHPPTRPGSDDTPQSAAERPATLDVEEYTTGPRSLSASVQLIWALNVLVGVAVLGGIAFFASRWADLPLTYVGIGVFMLAILAMVWVHLRHRIWTYRVREDALFLERGVVTRVNTVVPYVRIQHVDTQRGPFERALGLSTLVVYTAGSRGADVSVPGLTTEEAADLQQRVKELAIEAEGGDAL